MFLMGMFSWWYTEGWRARVRITRERLIASTDYFSIGLLITSLFAPFRQISAGQVDGPIADRMRAFADRSISRLVGSIVRSGMILSGLVVMLFQSLFGAIEIAVWPVIPFFPVIGLIMMIIGWVPRWT
jgi:hypothetical protein